MRMRSEYALHGMTVQQQIASALEHSSLHICDTELQNWCFASFVNMKSADQVQRLCKRLQYTQTGCGHKLH